jgi:succinate dehydrogenase/fumarate reductase flavoprotein subunit
LRNGHDLDRAVEQLDALRRDALPRLGVRGKTRRYNPEWLQCLQVENMLTTLSSIARSARLREESRGAHYRRDFPSTDNQRWHRNIILNQKGDDVVITTVPVRTTSMAPPQTP